MLRRAPRLLFRRVRSHRVRCFATAVTPSAAAIAWATAIPWAAATPRDAAKDAAIPRHPHKAFQVDSGRYSGWGGLCGHLLQKPPPPNKKKKHMAKRQFGKPGGGRRMRYVEVRQSGAEARCPRGTLGRRKLGIGDAIAIPACPASVWPTPPPPHECARQNNSFTMLCVCVCRERGGGAMSGHKKGRQHAVHSSGCMPKHGNHVVLGRPFAWALV